MNKLMGFYELKSLEIPTIQWEEYNDNSNLQQGILWTIRSAVFKGDDLSLPRKVGVEASEAKSFASATKQLLGDNGMVIYYPYFIAEKSGTLNVFSDKIVIEAVKEDLWNLVTYSDRDVTIQIAGEETIYDGNPEFILSDELEEILKQIPKIKRAFRGDLLQGESILLEWSFAYNCDLNKQKIGQKYLVFYEARTV